VNIEEKVDDAPLSMNDTYNAVVSFDAPKFKQELRAAIMKIAGKVKRKNEIPESVD
jgi:hypothetical protein